MTELTLSQRTQQLPHQYPRVFLGLAAVAWWLLYQSLAPASEALVAMLPVDRVSHLGGALQFFLYDTPKVLLLLTAVVFVMGMVNSYFTPERTRALLAGRDGQTREGVANVMAASLGIVTPFCSCSAVPLFIGFVQAGVPLGVTFSFLISAPMVNEVALVLLFGLFGWRIAALYLGLGLMIAIVAGWIIGRLKMEAHLEDWVRDMPKVVATAGDAGLSLQERINAGFASVREIVGKVWPYILVGISLGAAIHGWVPGLDHGQGRTLVVGAAGRADRRADVHQRGRRDPHRAGAAGQGRGAGHRAGLHDERDRAIAARDDHPAQGAQAQADRHFRRCRGHRHPDRRLRLQRRALNAFRSLPFPSLPTPSP